MFSGKQVYLLLYFFSSTSLSHDCSHSLWDLWRTEMSFTSRPQNAWQKEGWILPVYKDFHTSGISKESLFRQVLIVCWPPFFFLKILFIWHRERERPRSQVGRQGGRWRNRFPTEKGAQCGARIQDPRIMTWTKDRCLTNWATRCPFVGHLKSGHSRGLVSPKGESRWHIQT